MGSVGFNGIGRLMLGKGNRALQKLKTARQDVGRNSSQQRIRSLARGERPSCILQVYKSHRSTTQHSWSYSSSKSSIGFPLKKKRINAMG